MILLLNKSKRNGGARLCPRPATTFLRYVISTVRNIMTMVIFTPLSSVEVRAKQPQERYVQYRSVVPGDVVVMPGELAEKR